MTFPTIPTVASGRLLTGFDTTPATATFPDLSGLTKNSGDLLIAIVAVYQSTATAGAVFSGWGGGFTEFVDQRGGTTQMSIGAAYKWSTGSETGTFSVTIGATITGHAALILMSIPGAHASTPPEGGTIAVGTTAAANPGALNPTGWDAEDTLWIAVGASGETSLTGSYTGMGLAAGPPTNYGDAVSTGESADVIGAVAMAVAFRQLNAASEDVGAWSSADLSNARNVALVIAVRPAPSVTYNSPALELSSFGTFTGVTAGATINKVTVSVTHKGDVSAIAPTVQLWDGATAQIGTTRTGTANTIDTEDTFEFTGVTYSQLATLRVRIYGSGPSASTRSVDAVSLTVNYIPASGPVEHQGAVTMTAPSTLSTAAVRTTDAVVTMTAPSTLVAAGVRGLPASVTMTAPSTLAAAAERSIPAAVAMTAPSVLATAAVRVTLGVVAMTAPSTLTTSGVRATSAVVAMTAPSTLVTAGVRTTFAAVTMTAPSTLVTAGVRTTNAAVAMTAPSVLVAGAEAGSLSYVTMTAPSVLAALARVEMRALVAMTASSTLSTAGVVTRPAAVAMTAPSILSTAAVRTTFAVVAMTAPSVLTAGPVVIKLGAVNMTAPSVLSTAAVRETFAVISMTAPSVLNTAGITTRPAAATMTAQSVLAVAAIRAAVSAVSMQAPSTLSVEARATMFAAVFMEAASVLLADAAAGPPITSPFFLWNGVAELPLAMSYWTGAAEVDLVSYEIV